MLIAQGLRIGRRESPNKTLADKVNFICPDFRISYVSFCPLTHLSTQSESHAFDESVQPVISVHSLCIPPRWWLVSYNSFSCHKLSLRTLSHSSYKLVINNRFRKCNALLAPVLSFLSADPWPVFMEVSTPCFKLPPCLITKMHNSF